MEKARQSLQGVSSMGFLGFRKRKKDLPWDLEKSSEQVLYMLSSTGRQVRPSAIGQKQITDYVDSMVGFLNTNHLALSVVGVRISPDITCKLWAERVLTRTDLSAPGEKYGGYVANVLFGGNIFTFIVDQKAAQLSVLLVGMQSDFGLLQAHYRARGIGFAAELVEQTTT